MELKNKLLRPVLASAFRYPHNLIRLFEGGSALHGATSEDGKADLDVYGVYVEPKSCLYGLEDYPHYVSSTAPEGVRNTSEDVDITLYSLRKWCHLAAKGNPTALGFVFADCVLKSTPWYQISWHYKDAGLLSRGCYYHFKGFVENQVERLLGTRGAGKHGQRPDLTTRYGYDTKAAMHAIRLLGEGTELLNNGWITYPRPDVIDLKKIRAGELSLGDIKDEVNARMKIMSHAFENSSLLDKPDYAKLSKSLIEVTETFFEEGQ